MDIHVLQSQPAQKVAFKDSSTVRVGNKLVRNKPPTQPSAMRPKHLVRGGFQPRLPTSLPPPGQQQQPSPLPRRQPVPLMPPAQLHPGAAQVVAPAPAVPLQSPPPSELMDVDPSAGPPSQAVAVQPVLQPLSLGTPKDSDTAAPCPVPTRQPSTQHQETLPLFVGPDAPSRPVPEAAPVVTGVHPDLGLQKKYFRYLPKSARNAFKPSRLQRGDKEGEERIDKERLGAGEILQLTTTDYVASLLQQLPPSGNYCRHLFQTGELFRDS
ncbi:translation initiation factor IF-2-like [Schistocerca nitens]|uniref:translation initiation factor IF-2-like n=1 Tax=Schistocerca nitens TaxID=7011 RepID=UPI0021184A18|nr:translation initiation factor IF-2-like [Schistocerca nitens]